MTDLALELRGLTKNFGALKATDNVSLEVRRGEIHALIGPNGAGKTTLIGQIFGNLAPDSGAVFLNGVNVTNASVSERAHLGIGRSFQISNVLMDFSVLENAIIAEISHSGAQFRFFTPAFSDPKLVEGGMVILRRVGMEDMANRKVADLAHGERRLLELALALALRPSLVLLDEPMAGASPEDTIFMTDVIAGFQEQTSILLIEHDMDVVFKLAGRISVLVEGAVIASGSPVEISQNPKVREAYLGSEE
ncbi:MAG: ATP-binding cassette domain-containing protein [Bacteroidetes bacterium]|jgi:branched-chain amino acid transport system ATP-binding protein|nr:ATP-binding cassette domain-containing protein [Bacteroidota bacterium]